MFSTRLSTEKSAQLINDILHITVHILCAYLLSLCPLKSDSCLGRWDEVEEILNSSLHRLPANMYRVRIPLIHNKRMEMKQLKKDMKLNPQQKKEKGQILLELCI